MTGPPRFLLSRDICWGRLCPVLRISVPLVLGTGLRSIRLVRGFRIGPYNRVGGFSRPWIEPIHWMYIRYVALLRLDVNAHGRRLGNAPRALHGLRSCMCPLKTDHCLSLPTQRGYYEDW